MTNTPDRKPRPEAPSTKAKQRRLLDAIVKLQRHGLSTEPLELGRRSFEQVADGLDALREQLRNRAETPRGRVVSDPVTPEKISEVIAMRVAHPKLNQQEIAHLTNLNIGRVSEILHGKRT